MDPQYRGYTGRNASYNQLMKNIGSSVLSSSRAWQEEEDRRKNAEFMMQEQQRLIETGVLNPDGTEKPPRNPLQRFGDTLGGVGSAIWEGTKETYSRAGQIGGNILAEVTGANRKIEENLQSIADGDWEMYEMAQKKSKDMTLDEATRNRWKDVSEQYKEKSFQSQQAVSDYYKEKQEKYDPAKAGWAIAEVGLDVVTAGSVGAIARGGRGLMKSGQLATKSNTAANLADPKVVAAAQKATDSRVASTVNKVINPAGLKQSLASGATLGVGYGITGTGVQMGDEATAGDFAQGAALGGALGGVLGGSINVAGQVGRSVFSRMKDRSTDTSKAAQELLKEAPEDVLNQPGFVDRINEMAANSRNVREMKESYNSYINELRSTADAGTPASVDTTIPTTHRLESGIEGQRAANDEALAKLQSGEDTSVYDYRDSQGNDVGEVARQYDQQISEIDTQIRAAQTSRNQLQRQSEGIDENTGQATIPEGPTGSGAIRKADLSTDDARRSPEVTPEEFSQHRERGKRKIEELDRTSSRPDALVDRSSWNKISSDAYNKTREEWGGVTVNAKTGELVEDGADAYALTMRNEGSESVSIAPSASKAEFQKAMNEAKKRFKKELSRDGAHLGVFHDADTGMIDIDPVLVTSKLEDVHDIGAYTRATGGAYHFKSGDGYWPPHIADELNPAEYTGDALGRTRAGEGVAKYDAEIADLQARKESIVQEQSTAFERMGGVSRTINPGRVREKFARLNAERSAIDAAEDVMANTPSAVQKQIDDLDSGNIPDDLIIDRGPAETADEAIRRAMKTDPQDSIGMQRVYQENQALREEAQDELAGLVTTQRYERYVADLNENYLLKQQEINELPGPQRKEEQALLDEDYVAQVSDMRILRDNDHQRVEELNEALRVADDIDNNIVNEWNSMEQSNPNIFGEVDEVAFDLYRDKLVARKAELDIEQGNRPNSPMDRQDNLDIAISDAKTDVELKEKLSRSERLLEEANELQLDQLTTGNGRDVNVIDTMLRKPVSVLRKMGTAGETMADILEEGLNGRRQFNGDLQARYKQKRWDVAMKDAYRDDFIGFLDQGKPLTRGAQESSQHFRLRQEAMDDVKLWLRETGEKLGLPEEMLNRNYLPHLIKKESGETPDRIAEAMAGLKAQKGVDGKPITSKQRAEWERVLEGVSPQTRQYIQQQQIYTVGENGFLKRRTGAGGWETDPRKIISAYSRAAANELYTKPALQKAQKVAGKFSGRQRRFVDELADVYNRGNMDEGGAIAKGASVARRVQNLALMGGSVRTVVLQLDGGTRIFAENDIGSFINSGLNAFQAMNPRSKLYQEATRAGALEDSFTQLLQGGSGLHGLANKTEKALYSGIAAVDTHMRIWAFDAGKRAYAKKLGKKVGNLTPEEEVAARQAGVDMANRTQFNMDALTIPIKQNTTAGKFLTQIQQFNINATKYNAKIMGKSLKSKEDFTKAAKLVVAYGALFATMTSASSQIFGEEIGEFFNPMGFDPEDILPFGEQAIAAYEIATMQREWGDFDVPMTPLLSFMFGSSYGDGVVDYISTAAKYQRGEIDDREFDAAMHQLPSFLLRNIVPAGTQINRSIEGYDTVTQGESVNRYGNTRFMVQNKGGLNLMKGIIAGQYATDEGQEWLRQGMNTISSKHKVTLPNGDKIPVSQYARSLAPEDQAQYIGYYQTKQVAERELAKNGMGRTAMTEGLKDKINSGQMSIAQAQLEAQQWNDKVRMLYAPYINGNESIPPRLVDDFTNNVIIDVSLFERMRGMSNSRMQQLNSYYE